MADHTLPLGLGAFVFQMRLDEIEVECARELGELDGSHLGAVGATNAAPFERAWLNFFMSASALRSAAFLALKRLHTILLSLS